MQKGTVISDKAFASERPSILRWMIRPSGMCANHCARAGRSTLIIPDKGLMHKLGLGTPYGYGIIAFGI